MRFRSTRLQPSRGQPAKGQKNKHSATNSANNRKSQKSKVDKSHKEKSPSLRVQPTTDRTLSKVQLKTIKSLLDNLAATLVSESIPTAPSSSFRELSRNSSSHRQRRNSRLHLRLVCKAVLRRGVAVYLESYRFNVKGSKHISRFFFFFWGGDH